MYQVLGGNLRAVYNDHRKRSSIVRNNFIESAFFFLFFLSFFLSLRCNLSCSVVSYNVPVTIVETTSSLTIVDFGS